MTSLQSDQNTAVWMSNWWHAHAYFSTLAAFGLSEKKWQRDCGGLELNCRLTCKSSSPSLCFFYLKKKKLFWQIRVIHVYSHITYKLPNQGIFQDICLVNAPTPMTCDMLWYGRTAHGKTNRHIFLTQFVKNVVIFLYCVISYPPLDVLYIVFSFLVHTQTLSLFLFLSHCLSYSTHIVVSTEWRDLRSITSLLVAMIPCAHIQSIVGAHWLPSSITVSAGTDLLGHSSVPRDPAQGGAPGPWRTGALAW